MQDATTTEAVLPAKILLGVLLLVLLLVTIHQLLLLVARVARRKLTMRMRGREKALVLVADEGEAVDLLHHRHRRAVAVAQVLVLLKVHPNLLHHPPFRQERRVEIVESIAIEEVAHTQVLHQPHRLKDQAVLPVKIQSTNLMSLLIVDLLPDMNEYKTTRGALARSKWMKRLIR